MKYQLAEACENTFVLFEGPDVVLEKARQCLEREGRDDALILSVQKMCQHTLYAEMTVLGPDGELGEFCGNGARACAAYLYARYPRFKRFFLRNHPLMAYGDNIYSIKLPPARFELNGKFITECPFNFHYVEMIEPHLIIQREMSDEELFSVGRELNGKKDLFPRGINVNAWTVLEDRTLFVKTYERGVQRLTRSCGTGSMACAAFYRPRGKIRVLTPGGELEITLQDDGIELKGPAKIMST